MVIGYISRLFYTYTHVCTVLQSDPVSRTTPCILGLLAWLRDSQKSRELVRKGRLAAQKKRGGWILLVCTGNLAVVKITQPK